MTLTQQNLQQDAVDNLSEFYAKERELTEQIKNFEESLMTARGDLRALRKDWRARLQRAGQYKSFTSTIESYVKENGPVNRRECVQHVLMKTNEELNIIEANINTCLEKGTISLDDENILRFTNRERVYTIGLRESILCFLKKQEQPVDIDAIARGVNSDNRASVRSCLTKLLAKNQVMKAERHRGKDKCLYTYCEPIPKQETAQCVSFSTSL